MIPPDASTVITRPAVLLDIDALMAIDMLCFPVGIAYPRQEILALLRARAVTTRIAEWNREIVGFASLSRQTQGNPQRGELVTIDVLPQFRRRGIGARLYFELEEWLREDGGSSIQLHVAIDNQPAMRFYRRLGYKAIQRVSRYYLDAIDAWLMEKALF